MKRRVLLAALLALLMAAALTSVAWAHANLLRSDPADGAILAEAPQEMRLWFDEPISARFSSAQLFDADSQPIDVAGIRTDPADPTLLILTLPKLPEGVYSVLWKVLSESDGHFSQGLLVFGIGEGADLGTATLAQADSAAPPGPEVVLRWLNFTLLAGLAGAVAILQLVLVPAARAARTDERVSAALRVARRRILGWVTLCALLALAVGLGFLLWQTISLRTTLPEGVSFLDVSGQVISGTRWGAMWLVREGLLLLLGGLLFWQCRTTVGSKGASGLPLSSRNLAWAATGLLSLALIFAQALSGHASGLGSNAALAVVADALHLLAASLWVGGLLALAVGLLPLLRRNRADFAALVRAGWRPFGRVAALSVGLLVATGLYSTGRQVASLDALLTTPYGRALLGKAGLVLVVGAFGLLNSMLLHPRLAAPLARLLRRPAGWTPLSLQRLPALVLAEVSLGLVVLLLTGLLTASPTPRGSEFTVAAEDVPSALSQSADDLVITLGAKPNRPGQNVLTVFAASTRRPPPAEISRVILRFDYLEEEIGRVSTTAEEVEPGRFMLTGNQFNLAGPWQVDVVVRRLGLEDSVARFNWTVAPPGESRPVVVSKEPLEPLLTIAAASALLILLLITAAVWLARNGFINVPRPSGWFELRKRGSRATTASPVGQPTTAQKA